jgi:hypothetical protein
MTSTSRTQPRNPPTARSGAGALAVSIATALIAALLMLAQGAPIDALSASIATDGAPPPSAAAEPLDTGVDWHRVERAPDPAGASVAAYER